MNITAMGRLARQLRNYYYYERSGFNPVLSPMTLIRKLFRS